MIALNTLASLWTSGKNGEYSKTPLPRYEYVQDGNGSFDISQHPTRYAQDP